MPLRVQPFETGPFGCLPAAAAQDRRRLRSVPPPGERTEKSRSPGGAIEPVEMASRRACPYAYFLSSSTSENSASTTSSSARAEEHTSELQSLMRTSYAVFCLKTKKLHYPYNH